LVSISALHELRAVFIDDQKNEFDSFIPMMIINIKTIDDDQNKKDFVFQTDLKSLKRLIEYLNNYSVKFSQLIARYENNIPIYYQSEPSKIEMKSEDDHSDK
jgi:hypothetical protein